MNENTDPAVAAARLGDELSSIAGRMSTVSDDFAALAEKLAESAVARFAVGVESEAAEKVVVEKAAAEKVVAPAPAESDRPAASQAGPQPVTPVAAQAAPQPAPQPVAPQPVAPQAPRQTPTVVVPMGPVPQTGPAQTGPIQTGPTQTRPPEPGPTRLMPTPQLQYATAPQGPRPPQGQMPFAPYPAPGWTPTPPAPKRSFSERLSEAAEGGLIGRVLAAVGVGITLIGIVLLLVLAAQAGLLRPEIRVAGGAVFAAALIGFGYRIGRREEKRSGALALLATGVAAALFDVIASTSIYHWLPPIAALLLGGAIGAGGLWMAHRWNSQTLGLMVSIPLLVFAPVVAGGVDETLVAFMMVYAASTLWMQTGRDWTPLYLVNTVATTLPLIVFAAFGGGSDWFLVIAGLVNLALALGSAVVLSASSTRALVLGLAAVGAGVPLLVMASEWVLTRPTATVTVALGALVFVVAALGTRGRASIPFVCRVVWLSAGAVFATIALAISMNGSVLPIGFLGAAIVVVAGTRWADDLADATRIIATVFGGLGLLALAGVGAVANLFMTNGPASSAQATVLVGALLGISAATLLAREWGEYAPTNAQLIWLAGGVIDLWLITVLCVSIGGVATNGSASGFRAGHMAATLIWFGSAAAALMWARTLTGPARSLALGTGLAVIAAAVAKLFLFDLAALAGVFRVIAFIVAGLVLLSLGVAYAQSLTSDDAETQPEPVPAAH
ncbi:DUF2339 domain-containing protein [Gordonia sp. (in: high G+C Gram-positive bacteria)]|uniref:DUF2339 domain-containing protein n=1 Tax=Gordonia sp. (in: high G+C Gram-positive bacteria) TaxID=84139 RepID=UPI0016AB7F6E|nr:DUF2339 domain-containing protein [Gordonia sp. (in: high G+C Gram-positive bacteria)]NLG46056.1 DUF2339 domain-containing protein [Gordonia sp. (in: high G+C Gram-positive bacteria)]